MPRQHFLLGLVLTGLALAATLGLSQDAEGPGERPTTRERLSKRAELSREAYDAQVAELRKVYSGPVSGWPAANVDGGVVHREVGLLPEVTFPEGNPYSKAKAELGRTLFWDARLSGSGQMSCVSCHDNDLGWADGRTVAFGHKVQPQKRNTPSVMNAAYSPVLFWDGRAGSLEQQALMPIGNPGEMHSSGEEAAKRIAEVPGYGPMFKEAFGSEEVTAERLGQAIATFERTIVGGRSKFDQFLRGNAEALSDSAVRGLHLFRTDARCINCHNGPEMSDHQFHNLGLSAYGSKNREDLGRYNITKDPKDVGAFKTPSLRNVTRTGPWMHTGLFEFDEIFTLYNGGGFNLRKPPGGKDDPLFPTKSALLKPLHLNDQDLEDLKEFVRALEEPRTRVRVPKVP